MSAQFTPCPACGAVGEVNSTCQFCGTTIFLKEGATTSDSRIVERRTVTPQQYAEKIAIYHNVVGLSENISKVSIGEQEGIVNLNGDLIYPLGNERISRGYQDGFVRIGDRYLNIENFEFIEDPYLNRTILDKIKTLSKAIKNNPSEGGVIQFAEDIDGNIDIILEILNATHCSDNNMYGWDPELTIRIMNIDMEDREFSHYVNRFASCDEFRLFETRDEESCHAFFGDDAEECCRIMLRILHEMHGILPENAANSMHMYCGEGVFEEFQSNSDTDKDSNTTGGGCLGMLACLLSAGGAGVYGIVELIGRFIA